MTELRNALEEYLAVRRALGFKLIRAGYELTNFLSFLEREGAFHMTTELALRWARQPASSAAAHWGARLGFVRGFARYHAATDPLTEIPPQGLLPDRYIRRPPYIYSDSEIVHLIEAAKRLPSATGLRPCTYSTLLGLLAVTGMRISEPIALDREDVDLTRGVLTVRQTKFGKSRLVPIHLSTQRALRSYARRRDSIHPQPKTPSFFVSDRGTRLTQWNVRWTFIRLSRQIGLRGPFDHYGPRLHDLRHRFAIQTLLNWYREGANVERHLPELATYLGHGHVADTYWYLSAAPELMRLAVMRLERGHGRVPS